MLLDIFFPNRCLNCNRIIAAKDVVCEICMDQIHFTHYNYHSENELKNSCKLLFPLENAYALMRFEEDSLSRKIVHELKYKSREKVGKILAEWTSERLDFGENKPDLLVSVPLHPKKLKERGYNQLHLFTETLSKKFGIPYDHEVIKRNFYKKAQALRDRSQREDTENLFSLNKSIENKHVLLIDDVFTTGNTMSSVAWEILKNPGNKVSVFVIAVD